MTKLTTAEKHRENLNIARAYALDVDLSDDLEPAFTALLGAIVARARALPITETRMTATALEYRALADELRAGGEHESAFQYEYISVRCSELARKLY